MTEATLLSLKEAVEQRRAARAFRPDPIPMDTLKEILRLGTRAPSGFNLQPWRFILLQDPASKAKLKEAAFGQGQVEQAPVVLICCGDRKAGEMENIEAVIQLGKEHGAITDDYGDTMRKQIPQMFEYKPCFESVEAWTNRHVMLAVAHLMVVAKAFGVDSCPMEGFMSAQVKESFNIPDHVDVCCLLPLGYTTEPFKLYGGRWDLNQVFYSESYGTPGQL